MQHKCIGKSVVVSSLCCVCWCISVVSMFKCVYLSNFNLVKGDSINKLHQHHKLLPDCNANSIMFPSCPGLIRSLNISLVILNTNPVTISCFLTDITHFVLSVTSTSVQQFPALLLWKNILFAFIFMVGKNDNMQIFPTLKSTLPKLTPRKTVQTIVLVRKHLGITSTLTPFFYE